MEKQNYNLPIRSGSGAILLPPERPGRFEAASYPAHFSRTLPTFYFNRVFSQFTGLHSQTALITRSK